MPRLPITHMTLYKHGVGFFERRAVFGGEQAQLSFRTQEMNDILKSLTAIDRGGGRVLSIDYATPQSREQRLAGCSIRPGDDRSLRDLLVSLRGRRVRLLLDQSEEVEGILLGLDELHERQLLATSLVSLLLDETAEVQAVCLGRVQGVVILDERAVRDLRFFLQTALTQEDYQQVTVRLSPGEHDLAISYIAPAPVWRVSYRLVLDTESGSGPGALLQGWGIFDNRLEEDLGGISLSLVAGMPISFIYDLNTPSTPERPVVKEEGHVAAAPVEFAEAESFRAAEPPTHLRAAMATMRAPAPAALQAPAMERAISADMLAESAPSGASGQPLGELFQYVIDTPVTVGRGQSAMVPILTTRLGYRKDLLYNGSKMPAHPVATLRLDNETGLTLERGPVTVLEHGEYVGEAILPFTVEGGEIVVPYAVELSVKVREESSASREVHRLQISGAYLRLEEWDVRRRDYQLHNRTGEAATVLVEHPRLAQYSLFDTPEPRERTDEHYRFEVQVPARGETHLNVQERRLMSRTEELRRQSYAGLQRYLRQGLLDPDAYEQVAGLLRLWEQVGDAEKRLVELEVRRQKIYQAQQQIQSNMAALSPTGKEGALRARYVQQLETSENELQGLARDESDLQDAVARLKAEIEKKLQALSN